LERIESIDKNGAKLNSVIEINPDVIALAKAMDLERRLERVEVLCTAFQY
jgi:amidase